MISSRVFRFRWFAIPVSFLLLASSGCQREKTSSDVVNTDRPKSGSFLGSLVSKPVVKTVPAGTTVSVQLEEALASNKNQPGDRFKARVTRDVVVDGSVVIPAGSEVSGVVTEARGLKKIGGRAKLGLEFTSVEPPSGSPTEIKASYLAEGKSETKRDAATIGGAAVGGAVLGRIIGHQHGDDARGTVIGGVVGAAAGTAVAASTKGKEIVLPSGHVLNVTLEAPAQVTLKG